MVRERAEEALRPLVCVFLASVFSASTASAQSWEFEYAVGENADQITSCNARIDYRDGAMIARIYGEEMDFFFIQYSLALPVGQVLGSVALEFKADTFIVSAASAPRTVRATTPAMFLTPAKSDYKEVLDAMKRGEHLSVVFPDGSAFSIELVGTESALERVGECWKNQATGPAGRNPFNANDGVNPFN